MIYREGQSIEYDVPVWDSQGERTVSYRGRVVRVTATKVRVIVPAYSARTLSLDKDDPALREDQR